MFVVTACCTVLQVFLASEQDRDPVLRELCKVSSLPTSILSFIERVCDDPVAQNNIQSPTMFVMDSMKQICSIVIQACRIQHSASPGPSINAQALLPSCLHLLKRFKPLVKPHSLTGSHPPIKVNTEFILDLLCATASLLYSSVPFPQEACRQFLTDLLRYIDIESDKSTKFAMLCCVGPTLARLVTPPAVASAPAASAALHSAASTPLQNGDYQQETIRALIKLLSQARRYSAPLLTHHPHPPSQASSVDLSASVSWPRIRELSGRFAALVARCNTIFGLALQNISDCIDSAGMAAFCVSGENGALLAIVCQQLKESAGEAEARLSVRFCETLIQLLCDINLRQERQEPFPDDLLPSLHHHMETKDLRSFFQEAQRSSPHAQQLHGGMVVPGLNGGPATTLKELANSEESPLNVLGYAAATHMVDAVRLLLQVGADPQKLGPNGKNAIDTCQQYNSSRLAEMTSLFDSVRENLPAAIRITEACAPKAPHPDVCLLVAPIWDALLDAADVTPAADVCFAILRLLLNLIAAAHPEFLENLFIAAHTHTGSSRSPRAFGSPTASDSPLSNAEPLSPASRMVASARAERLFKLLAQVARKFSRSRNVQDFARSVLDALLTLLKALPIPRPLARLCHRRRLVDLLSELVRMQDEHRSACPSPDGVVAELRAMLESHMPPLSDRSPVINEMKAIAHALAVAVVGSAALPQPTEPVITAHDALNFLCDSAKVCVVHFKSCQHVTSRRFF
jgi:hypothetical protein